jgi:PAS domain S-box-containing protein
MNTAPAEVQEWLEGRLFDSVPTSIAVIDRDYRIVLANHSFEQLFGEWRGRLCWETYKGQDHRCENCPAAQALDEGKLSVRHEVGRGRNGEEAHYLVHVAPIQRRSDGTIPFCVEMSTDVTELHRVQHEKLEAERLAAVGQTVSGLAHGIKNIITGLEGGMYVMRTGLRKGRQDRIDSGWEMLERNVERISSLAKNLLSFSKGHTPDVQLVHPGDLVRDVSELYREAASRIGISIEAVIADAIAPAPLDAEEIHGSLANLVSNAIDACQMSDRKTGRVEIRVYEDGEALIFEVTDDGVGMDVEVKRKIFTTFFTTKGSSGTGLGLLLLRKVAQEHGGKVFVDTALGSGTSFRIVLPRDALPSPDTDELPLYGEVCHG